MKNLINKEQLKRLKKQLPQGKHIVFSGLVLIGLLLGFSMKKTIIADNDSVVKGVFGGAAVGGVLGGAIGGKRGVGPGLAAGALLGGAIGASGRSDDPYRELDKEQRKLAKLQDRLAKAKPGSRQDSLQRQIDLQVSRIRDLEARLGVRPAPMQPMQRGYQPAGYR